MALSLCVGPSASLSVSIVRNSPQPRNGPGVRLLPRDLLSNSCPPAFNLHRTFPSFFSQLNLRRSPGSFSHLHAPINLEAAQWEGSSLPPVLQSYQGDSPAEPQVISRGFFEPPIQPNQSMPLNYSDQLEVKEVVGGGGGDINAGGGDGSGWNGGNGKPGNGGEGEGESGDKKKKMLASQKLTLAYAVLVGVGGAIGYAKKKSTKSLISGAVSSLLLFYVSTRLPVNPVYASSLGLGVSGVLVAVTGIRFKETGKFFPAGVFSLVSFIMAGGYIHGIVRASHA